MSINKKTYSEQIYDSLKEDILSQHIPLGAPLINRELQERFHVSSTPVRDAINRLWQDGLLEDITKVGSKVIDLDLDLFAEVNEIMSILCTAAVEISFQKGNHPFVVEKLSHLVSMEALSQNDAFLIEQDAAFHLLFFVEATNKRLLTIYEQNRVLWEMVIRHLHKARPRFSDTLGEHQAIVRAYEAKDIKLAKQRMKQHFTEAFIVLKSIYYNQ